MEFKPESVTQDEATKIVSKFKEWNKGVVIGAGSRYANDALGSRKWDAISAKWTDLLDENKFSIQDIKNKMFELHNTIVTRPVDSLLGDTSIAFYHTTDRGKRIPFYYTDMYIFLREGLKERKETAKYKAMKSELADALDYINKNKSQDEKLKEAQELVSKLRSELGDEDMTVTPAPTTTATAQG